MDLALYLVTGLPSTLSGGAQVSVTEVLEEGNYQKGCNYHQQFRKKERKKEAIITNRFMKKKKGGNYHQPVEELGHLMQFLPPSIITSSSLARQIPGGFGLSADLVGK